MLSFWFPDKKFQKFWFKKDINFDEKIRTRYLWYLERVKNNEIKMESRLEHKLAKIIMCDQFSRNIFRDCDRPKEYDNIALKTSLDLLDHYKDRFQIYCFILLPIRHSRIEKNILLVKKILDGLDNNMSEDDTLIYKKFCRKTEEEMKHLLHSKIF